MPVLLTLLAAIVTASSAVVLLGQPSPGAFQARAGDFALAFDGRGLTGLANPNDPFNAQLVARNARFGVSVRYRVDEGDWLEMFQTGTSDFRANTAMRTSPDGREVSYTIDEPGTVLRHVQTYRTDGRALDWIVDVGNRMDFPVRIGDFVFALPWRAPGGENPDEIFERSWTKHQFISGHGSFLYFVRPNGQPPYLVVTTLPGTKLEYYQSPGGRGAGFQAFVHSAVTGNAETRGTWRQAHSDRMLGPAGSDTSSLRYGLRFRWASSHDEMRQILFDEGSFDVRVVPGMTVPEDLEVTFLLRTKARIEHVRAEFPAQTTIADLGEQSGGGRAYRAGFRRLGENRLTIVHDGGRETHLEFFVTEPLETLIKKRAQFLVTKQQHRDPSKWYDGLFSVYDTRAKLLRGPDDTDGFDHWWGYVLAADDPVLGKAPFLASKNLRFPDRDEIAAIEYYLERFVWGKLQRTDQETPYPYGVHGVPNWKVARDPRLRAGIRNTNLDKMKVWRSYDYPHMVMLYFHMYEIAREYPALVRYLDARGYLERAYQTARAYFIYPYEILPWYETYKWGCYNELVILDLMDALEREGRAADAAWLRGEWEKKVKYFVYDDKYPFRSEYAIDRTAFESSYALAKYGATHDMKPDENLWFDKNRQRWYSHPSVKREDSRAFMDRQRHAGLAVRGWLEPAYYLLGSDFTGSSDTGALSYMAKMGGWGILDYGLNFAPAPWDWLQLGYNSYLSSWALMNTGRADTNYGYWFPGPENDGATGWAFMTAKFGRAWIRKDVPRGPWHYDGEIDLGYGAGLRMAQTIVTRDPQFGLIAYGGTLAEQGTTWSVVPKDGLRQRLAVVLPGSSSTAPLRKLRVELARDGFAAGQPVEIDSSLTRLAFTIENRTADSHRTTLRLSLPEGAAYEVRVNGRRAPTQPSKSFDYPLTADVAIGSAPARVELVRR